MLNPVAPVQMPAQAQAPQPVKGHEESNHAGKPESGKFDDILAREVAEKESAPAKDHAKETVPDASSKQTESAPAAPVEQVDNAVDKTRLTQATDAADAADSTVSTDSTHQSKSESATEQIQVSQALLLENSVGVEIMSPVVPTENFAPHKIQSGLINKVANAIPDSGAVIAAAMQSVQPDAQEGFIQNPVGSSNNNLMHVLRTANFVDDATSPALSSGFQRNFFAQGGGGANLSLQTGIDMPQTHSLSGLSDVIQTGEANLLLQTDVDMLQPHNQSGSGGLMQAASNTALQTTATVTPHPVNLDMQMDQPKWGNEFSQKIVWLAHQQHQVAELRLNPAHLGPVEIMLSLTGDNGGLASAQFVSPHLAVREAIEAALPRLREMMAESGIQLGDVMVGAESFQRQEQGERQGHQHAKNSNGVNGFNAQDELNPRLEKHLNLNRYSGIVNTFA